MQDRTLSAGSVAAGFFWGLSLALWVAAWFVGDEVGRLSIIVCGVAVTATIRSYFVGQDQRFRAALAVTSTVTREPVTTLPRQR